MTHDKLRWSTTLDNVDVTLVLLPLGPQASRGPPPRTVHCTSHHPGLGTWNSLQRLVVHRTMSNFLSPDQTADVHRSHLRPPVTPVPTWVLFPCDRRTGSPTPPDHPLHKISGSRLPWNWLTDTPSSNLPNPPKTFLRVGKLHS